MTNLSKKILLANAFGTLGYFSCIFSWGWAALLYVPMMLENKLVEDLILPTPAEEIARQPIISQSSPLMMVFALIVTVVVVVATVIVLIKIPIAVAKNGKAMTTKVAKSATPLITRNKPLPESKKKILTANIIKLIKLLLVIIPTALVLLGSLFELPLPYEIIVLVSGVLSLFSLFWFSLQYISARLLRIEADALV